MTNKHFVTVTCFLLCLISCNFSSSQKEELASGVQKCSLIFRSQDEITVRVYKPIDDTFNYAYISDVLDLKPNISISYELEVNDFGCVMCLFPNGRRYFFYLEPGNQVEVNYESGKVNISGNNAEGHIYYNNKYMGDYNGNLRRLFLKDIINYDSIYYCFEQDMLLPYRAELKEMEKSGSITPSFSAILDKNLYLTSCFFLRGIYEQWLIYSRYKSYEPGPEDIRSILSQMSRLYDAPYATGDDIKKLPSYHMGYNQLKYKYLDAETKEELTEKRNFGAFPFYLLASDSLQLQFYGKGLISDLQDGQTRFNQEKLLAYLSEKFPDSEYVAIIKRLMAQKQSSEVSDEIIIIDNSPSSLKELTQIPGIKGKYAYVDLWETACIPCVYEFKYNDDVHKLLAAYNNLVSVYISIDKDKELWKSRVEKFDLKGYNIMASESLQKDIGMKVYDGTKVGAIPRYLLLDIEGNIVNDNLPRPSRSVQLKPILADVFK